MRDIRDDEFALKWPWQTLAGSGTLARLCTSGIVKNSSSFGAGSRSNDIKDDISCIESLS